MSTRDAASLLALILVLVLSARVLVAIVAPSLLDWLNEKAPFFPEQSQPVRLWRRLSRVWLAAFLLAGLMAWIRGDLWLAGLCAAAALYFGNASFMPGAAERHASRLLKLAGGHCPWCGFFFGRERPAACPACSAALPPGSA